MSLKLQTVRGALWTMVASLSARGIGVISTLLLTRFVSRESYGEAVAVAAGVVFLAHRLASTGAGQYIVSNPSAPRKFAFHMTVFHISFGALSLGSVVALTAPLSELLNAPNLARYLPGLAAASFIECVGYMPERVLMRDMRFRELGTVRMAGELTFGVLTVGTAALGYGAFAYVIGNVARSGVRTAMLLAMADRRDWLSPCRLDRETTITLARYAGPMWLGSLFGQAPGKVDDLMVSHFYGPEIAGMYNLAYNIADMPSSQIGEQLGEVLLPSFARMNDAEQRRRAFVRATIALVFLVAPLALGLAIVAEDLVATFFKPEFAPVAPLLAALAGLSITRPIGWANYALMIARSNIRALMMFEALKLSLLVVAIIAAAPFGVLWAALGVGVGFAAHAVGGLLFLRGAQGIPLGALVRGLSGPLAASAVMVATVALARRGLTSLGVERPALALCFEVVMGGITYLAGSFVFARSTLIELFRLVREALQRRRVVAAPGPAEPPRAAA